MCGIGGCLSNQPVSPHLVQLMMTRVAHRGPDDEGYVSFSADYEFECGFGEESIAERKSDKYSYLPTSHVRQLRPSQVIFGHRRLSIIDLSASGHQPMSIEEDRYWISYNGEIYNYLELRKELEICGMTFRTETDTEVLLKAFVKWGTRCFERFNGMWSLAIFDRKTGVLTLARDRFGVKPLYLWSPSVGSVFFASEIKQFLDNPNWLPKLNERAAHDFLAYGNTDTGIETLFADVIQLLPGHFLQTSLQHLRSRVATDLPQERWYQLKTTAWQGTYQDAQLVLQDLLKSAVDIRLRSDVKIGTSLSGGLDSSIITMLANGLLGQSSAVLPLNTFTASSDESSLDELVWAKTMNDWLATKSHITTPNAQTLSQDFLDMAYIYDEPVGSPGIHMQSEVFRMAKGMSTPVLLNGQGADEILGGYDTFLAAELAELVLSFHPVKAFKEMGQIRKLRGKSWAWGIAATGDLIAPSFISNFVRNAAGRNSTSPSWLTSSGLTYEKPRIHSVTDLQQILMSGAGLRHLLRYEDRSSMRWSIESRLPFLDYRVVEFAMSLPGSYLCSSGLTKRIARDSFRTAMPEAITQRIDKKGFSTPSSQWLTEMAPPLYKEEISRMMARNDHPINSQVMNLFNQSTSNKENPQLWRALSFASWFNRFM